MKTITALAAATLVFLPATILAEGKGNSDWAEDAAKKYEHKAELAEKEGMPKAAAIYRRMAEIKREAGVASKHGKKYDWSEYHKLEGKLNHIKKEHHLAHKDRKEHHEKHAKNDHGKEHAGDGFLKAAEEYRKQAHMAREHGNTDKARILMQLAEHKVAAAKAAKHGKDYDWTAYHKLQKELHGGEHKEHKKDWAHKEHDKPHDKHVGGGKLNIE